MQYLSSSPQKLYGGASTPTTVVLRGPPEGLREGMVVNVLKLPRAEHQQLRSKKRL
jgi:hypothetical protein